MIKLFVRMSVLGILLWCFGCDSGDTASEKATAISASPTSQRVFQVKGVVRELRPNERTVVVQHEAIPGYMAAMTMPFAVHDTNELHGLQINDVITFRMVVTDQEGWIEGIEKLSAPLENAALKTPNPKPVRVVPDVEPLSPGDLLPEYHFTNELGRVVSTKEFLGQALAITFFFTSCPYPDFCPRMSRNFSETMERLKTKPGGPTNWHLLSISFDTRVDSPERLLAYARTYQYDPVHWSFLTGELVQIDGITEQLGLFFWRPDGVNLTHNLSTAVFDTHGRLQKILAGNKWTSDELVAELTKAATP